jgi:polysaccharide pyruvyl transferase WcaK-like protein
VLVAMANIFNIPVGYISAGIAGTEFEDLRKECIKNMDYILVRDHISKKEVKEIVPNCEVITVPDPVFCPPAEPHSKPSDVDIESIEIVVCGRYVNYRDAPFDLDDLATALDGINRHVTLVPMHYRSDKEFCEDLANISDSDMNVINKELTFREVNYLISKAELVVGVRLHSIIMAIQNKTPFVGISYHRKCKALLQDYGIERIHNYDRIEPSFIKADVSEQLATNSNYINNYQKEKNEELNTLFNIIERIKNTSKKKEASLGLYRLTIYSFLLFIFENN